MQTVYFYLFCIIFSLFFFILYKKEKGKEIIIYKKISLNKIYLILSASIPILVCGLRYNVGADYYAYTIRYNESILLRFSEGIFKNLEFGDYLLSRFCHLFTNNPQMFFFIYTLLTIIFFYKAIINYKTTKINSFIIMSFFLCTYWLFMMNGVRQALALSILVYSYKYLYNKNIFKFCFFVFLAASFHFTSYIILPFGILWIFLNKHRYRNQIIILFYLLTPISIYYFLPIFSQVLPLKKYLIYINGLKDFSCFGFGVIIRNIPILSVLTIFYKKLIKINENNELHILLLIIGIFFEQLAYISPHISRLSIYFIVIKIFLLPSFAELSRKESIKKGIYILLFLSAIIYNYIYLCYYKNFYDIFPFSIKIFDYIWSLK